jgi:hypothetical protein
LKRGLSGRALISGPVVFRGFASNASLVAAPVHMIELTDPREITPYVWVHPDYVQARTNASPNSVSR